MLVLLYSLLISNADKNMDPKLPPLYYKGIDYSRGLEIWNLSLVVLGRFGGGGEIKKINVMIEKIECYGRKEVKKRLKCSMTSAFGRVCVCFVCDISYLDSYMYQGEKWSLNGRWGRGEIGRLIRIELKKGRYETNWDSNLKDLLICTSLDALTLTF